MKLKAFIISAVSLAAALPAWACGPFYAKVPRPDYLKFDISANDQPEDNARNIALWKQETSPALPDSAVVNAVYTMSKREFEQAVASPSDSTNALIRFALDHNRRDIVDFLLLAKDVEEKRFDQASPWYYPKDSLETLSLYQPDIDECLARRGGKFHNRYGLQLIRCLFSQRDYERCIAEYEKWFAGVPDSDLFKQMSMDYIFGAYTRLGRPEEADRYTALRALVYDPHTFDLVAGLNPSEDNLWKYVNGLDHRSASMMRPLLPTVRKVLDGDRRGVRNIGRWLLLGAYIENEFAGNTPQARKWLAEAARIDMPAEMANHIRAYSMLLDARSGKTDDLTARVEWLVSRIEADPARRFSDGEDAWNYGYPESYWGDVLKHLAWDHWVPTLLRQRNAPMAFRVSMTADYAELEANDYVYYSNEWFDTEKLGWKPRPRDFRQARNDTVHANPLDYGSYTFNMMYAQRPEDVIAWQRSLGSSPLDRHGRHDADFVNELIGTMLLRDQRYAEAEKYLARVSPDYQKTLNTYKGGYLNRDFTVDCNYEPKFNRYWNDQSFTYIAAPAIPGSSRDAKLRFAREMAGLQREMDNPDPNKSALAQVEFAIRMMNSYESCWALTAYRKGFCLGTMYDNQYYTDPDHGPQFQQYSDLIDDALGRFNDPESAARAELLLHNYEDIAAHYPRTSTARYLRANCDRYEDWLGWTACPPTSPSASNPKSQLPSPE